MTRTVLCVAPHPDDESIGCGGTLAQHVAAGDLVRVLWLTSGEAAGGGAPEEVGARREGEAAAAAAALGADVAGFWRLPDGRLVPGEDDVARLRALLRTCDVLYAPHPDDGHADHRAAAHMAREAAAGLGELQAWGYEVWTPIRDPAWVNDISEHISTKLAAIRSHRSQCDVVAFDDAAEGLARYRAHLHCWPGTPTHAEAFTDLRAG